VEIRHVRIDKTNAPRYGRFADGLRLIGMVNTVKRIDVALEQIERTCAEKIAGPSGILPRFCGLKANTTMPRLLSSG